MMAKKHFDVPQQRYMQTNCVELYGINLRLKIRCCQITKDN